MKGYPKTLKEWYYDFLPQSQQKSKLNELMAAVGKSKETVKRRWIDEGVSPNVGYRLTIEVVTGFKFMYNDTPAKAKVA